MYVVSPGASVVCQAHLGGSQESTKPLVNKFRMLLCHPYNLHVYPYVASIL
jgi:hypothetical protein